MAETLTRLQNVGEFASSFAMIVAAYFVIGKLLPETWQSGGKDYSADGVFYAIIIGLIAGLAIGKITEYYTGTGTKPVRSIVDQSVTGYATNIISGLGVGMISTTFPILILAAAVVGAYEFAGLYGIAIAPWGCFHHGHSACSRRIRPISDNAGVLRKCPNCSRSSPTNGQIDAGQHHGRNRKGLRHWFDAPQLGRFLPPSETVDYNRRPASK